MKNLKLMLYKLSMPILVFLAKMALKLGNRLPKDTRLEYAKRICIEERVVRLKTLKYFVPRNKYESFKEEFNKLARWAKEELKEQENSETQEESE